jgi:uncharacterized protein YerC
MAKVDYRAVEPAKRREMMEQLATVFATLRNKDSIRFLLERLLTESEAVMITRRLRIAELLVGGLTYDQIKRKLRVGTSTIRDVDGWLTDAAYEYHLIREEQRHKARSQRKKRHTQKTIDGFPPELQRILRGDTRFILFRLLLGDF